MLKIMYSIIVYILNNFKGDIIFLVGVYMCFELML